LFAPTWSHGTNRNIIPFGLRSEEFLHSVSRVVNDRDAILVVRPHLNTELWAAPTDDSIRFLPSEQYPDTEAVLLVTDVLICDWSSIVFDFLLLDRPTIFLDEPAPFPMGFTLDPSYRFGSIVSDMPTLESTLARYLDDPKSYVNENGARPQEVRQKVYGTMADGRASGRYVDALRAMVDV
jgi:CDP-glycerol glycerophosphotransferase